MEAAIDDNTTMIRFLAALFRRALDDAARGRPDAVEWLNFQLPEWRRYTMSKQQQTETTEQMIDRLKAAKLADEAAHAAKLKAARDAITAEAEENSKARTAALEAAQAAHAAKLHAAAAATEQREKALALVAWKSNGGTEDQFNEAWPQMRREKLQRRMMAQDEATAAATEQWYRARF